MASQRDQDRVKREPVSAQRRLDEHESPLSGTSIKVPHGANVIQIKKEGVRRFNIIAYEAGEGNPFAQKGKMYYERTYWVHPRIGLDENTYVCSRKTFGKPCFLCEQRSKLAKDPDANEDELKELKPKERQLWNIEDDEDKKAGVQLFDYSVHLFGKFIDQKINNADPDEKVRYKHFADPDEGFLVRAAFTEEKGGGYTYYKAADIEFKKRDPIPDDVLSRAFCLDELIKETAYEDLKRIFLQIEDKPKEKDDKSKDEDPDRKPRGKKAKDEEKPKEKEKDDDRKPKDDKKDDDRDRDRSSKKSETAESKGIKVGDEVVHEDYGTCIVTRISDDGSSLGLEDKKDEVHRGVPVSAVSLKKEKDDKPKDDDRGRSRDRDRDDDRDRDRGRDRDDDRGRSRDRDDDRGRSRDRDEDDRREKRTAPDDRDRDRGKDDDRGRDRDDDRGRSRDRDDDRDRDRGRDRDDDRGRSRDRDDDRGRSRDRD